MSDAMTPAHVFAKRVREARQGRNMTQQQVVDGLAVYGRPMDRSTLVKIEKGERAPQLDTVLGLAAVLGVFPRDLIVPLDDEAELVITPRLTVPARAARRWIAGEEWLPFLPDLDLAQVPRSELRRRVEEELARTISPLARNLMDDAFDAQVARTVALLLGEAVEPDEPKEDDNDG